MQSPPGQPGDATRSMRLLIWAMGEYIDLVAAVNRASGDAPSAVVRRDSTDEPLTPVTSNVTPRPKPTRTTSSSATALF